MLLKDTFHYSRIIPVRTLLTLIAVAWSISCAPGPPISSPATRQVTDETGRTIQIATKIDRVVSLAPNLTEIIFALGAADRLVGNTTFCDYPEEARKVARVGDTLQPSIERIVALKPQLVLVSTASQLEAFTGQLADYQIAVYVTDPRDLEGVFTSIQNVGQVLGEEENAKELVVQLRARTVAVEETVKNRPAPSVFYQLSTEPLFTAGRDAFATDLIRRAGGKSVTANVPGAWPSYSTESALAARPEVIILPTGGSMGDANAVVNAALNRSPAVAAGRVYKINGDLLVRPGPRAIDGLEEIARALHPDAFER